MRQLPGSLLSVATSPSISQLASSRQTRHPALVPATERTTVPRVQSTRLLDLMDSYIDERGHTSRRLDGSTSLEDRTRAMDEFNGDPACFVMLLSTRAGGTGVNLMSADTVIFYDSDWNPQQDLQARPPPACCLLSAARLVCAAPAPGRRPCRRIREAPAFSGTGVRHGTVYGNTKALQACAWCPTAAKSRVADTPYAPFAHALRRHVKAR